MAETLTTQLQAINIMLGTIGEAPVNSIVTGPIPADVQTAKDILSEVSREVQSKGWSFNFEYKVTLLRDLNGYITLAGNCLKVDLTVENGQVDVVQRGLRLYDRKNHTYIFTINPVVDIIYFLSWDELPEQARRYINIKAARIFQNRIIGSETLTGFTQQDEFDALTRLQDIDSENADYSIFDNYSTYSIVQRRK